jgi:hypothetical protein
LYRQYPRGVPDRFTYHQQPFAQLARAYQVRGDLPNLTTILAKKTEIELSILADRLSAWWLFWYGTYSLGFYWLANAYSNKPVVSMLVGFGVGVLASCMARAERESVRIRTFVALGLILIGAVLLEFHCPMLGHIPLTLLIFKIFSMIVFTSWFLVKLFQVFFGIGFNYLLSPRRGFIVFLIFIGIGTVCVEHLKEQGLLVIDPMYVAQRVSNEQMQMEGRYESDVRVPCGDVTNSVVHAADVFVPLIDFRQEFRCHLAESRVLSGYTPVVVETNWWKDPKLPARGTLDFWILAQGLYTVLGWIITSMLILSIGQWIRLTQTQPNDRGLSE